LFVYHYHGKLLKQNKRLLSYYTFLVNVPIYIFTQTNERSMHFLKEYVLCGRYREVSWLVFIK